MIKYYKRTSHILGFFQDYDKLFKDWKTTSLVDETTGETFYRTEINGEVLDFDRNDYLQLLAQENIR